MKNKSTAILCILYAGNNYNRKDKTVDVKLINQMTITQDFVSYLYNIIVSLI